MRSESLLFVNRLLTVLAEKWGFSRTPALPLHLCWCDTASCLPRLNTSACNVACLSVTLKSKISPKSSKELYWESFTASEQSAYIWLMCVSFRLIECKMPSDPGKVPEGPACSTLSQDINAVGLGCSQLLSSMTPARKQEVDLWGL